MSQKYNTLKNAFLYISSILDIIPGNNKITLFSKDSNKPLLVVEVPKGKFYYGHWKGSVNKTTFNKNLKSLLKSGGSLILQRFLDISCKEGSEQQIVYSFVFEDYKVHSVPAKDLKKYYSTDNNGKPVKIPGVSYGDMKMFGKEWDAVYGPEDNFEEG